MALLLAALLAVHGMLALAGTATAAVDPAICRSLPDSGSDGAGDRDHRHHTCLLCLPGCSALAAGDIALTFGHVAFAIAPPALAAAQRLRAQLRHAPYRPRGPPA